MTNFGDKISFNRYACEYTSSKPMTDIENKLAVIEADIVKMMAEVS